MSESKADEAGEHEPVEIEWQFDALDLRPVERWLATLPDPRHRDRRRGDDHRAGQTAAAPGRLLSRHRRLAHRPRRLRRAHAPPRPSRRGHPQGQPSRRRQRTAPTSRGHRSPAPVRPRRAGRRRAGRAPAAGHRRLAPPTRGAAGPHPAAALRAAGRRHRRGRGRARRHHDRGRQRAAAHAAAPGRGRGPARLARGAGADRGAAAPDVRAATGPPLQVRSGLVGPGRGDPGHARPRADRGLRHVHHGRRGLRGAAPPAGRAARQGAGHPAGRGSRRAARHAGGHAAPAGRPLAVRRRAARPRPGVPRRSSGGWPGCSAPSATSTCSWRTWRPCRSAMPIWRSVPSTTAATPWPSWSALLEREREAARADMLQGLDSVRWDRLAKGLTVMAQQGPARRSLATREPAVIGLPELVLTRHEKVDQGRQAGQAVRGRDRLSRPAHPLQTAALRPRVQQRRLRRADVALRALARPCCRASWAKCRTPRWPRCSWPPWPQATPTCPPPPSS